MHEDYLRKNFNSFRPQDTKALEFILFYLNNLFYFINLFYLNNLNVGQIF